MVLTYLELRYSVTMNSLKPKSSRKLFDPQDEECRLAERYYAERLAVRCEGETDEEEDVPLQGLPLPRVSRTCDSDSDETSIVTSDSSSDSDERRSRRRKGGRRKRSLRSVPPIGVFWDIENCQVPKGRSAVVIAQTIRDKFFSKYRETEFVVVCDVKKENAQVIQELNDAQVNLVHVSSQSKNAADDKLRQEMRRFADIHGSPSAIMLISGDINFSADLCDLRHRKKIHIILLHNDLCSQSLILCATEHYSYSKLVDVLPMRGSESQMNNIPVEVMVSNLPIGYDPAKVRNKLKRLSENCGGRVGVINEQTATIRFSSIEFATRARKRMSRELVFGAVVQISSPYTVQTDEDNINNSAVKKQNLWRNYENSSQGRDTRMFNFLGNTNQPVCNGSSSTPDLYVNDYRSYQLFQNRGPSFSQNNFNNDYSRNGPRNFQNQENVMHPNSLPAWYFHTPTKSNNQTKDHKQSRQVLGTCDNNTRCVSNEQPLQVIERSNVPWQFRNQSALQPNYLQNNSHDAPPVKPITILKRNPASNGPPNSQEVTGTNVNKQSNQFQISSNQSLANGSARKSNGTNFESDRYFHPISSNNSNATNTSYTNKTCTSPVELHITNLDQNMDQAELRKSLLNAFGEFTTVLTLSVYVQSDGYFAASVKVPSSQDAQFVISKLHRKKIGFKRITISYAHSGASHNPTLIRSQTISLLMDVPRHQLPLFKFRELYEKRFYISPSISDLYKMKDVCVISEDDTGSGRCITLHPDVRNSPSPMLLAGGNDSLPTEQSFCQKHWKPTSSDDDKGWAELEISILPTVKVELSEFTKNVHYLVSTHQNYLLLSSFCDCYEAECGRLTYDESGVPLEHLATCISGIELVQNSSTCIKYLTTTDKSNFDDKKSDSNQSLSDSSNYCSPSLANNLALFSRELVDLLKTFTHCMMPFNRFIPAYHHHFGRQCRVADYGYTKLIDLLEALPSVIQVIGEGNRRIITLSHKAQIRRFTSDLLRVLKSLASKQTSLAEFPVLFEKTLNRPFDPVDYGLCSLEDLLSQVSENTIVISSTVSESTPKNASNVLVAIPKREQTADEIERTKAFAAEVVELLSHAPQCSMLFNKFIPAYHHHYGHQCKVSDFGFTKLIELFEAIPDVVKIEEDTDDADRRVTLKDDVKLKVLGDQLAALVMSHPPDELSISNLGAVFLWQYGYALKPSVYGFETVDELIKRLSFAIKVADTPTGPVLRAVDKNQLKFLALKCRRVLVECSTISQMRYEEFRDAFRSAYNETVTLETLERELSSTVQVVHGSEATMVKLTPIEIFARDVYLLLLSCNGCLPLNAFENAYLRMYGTAVQPVVYGCQTVHALLRAIPQTIVMRGKMPNRIIMLNTELASVGFHIPKAITSISANGGRLSTDGSLMNSDQKEPKEVIQRPFHHTYNETPSIPAHNRFRVNSEQKQCSRPLTDHRGMNGEKDFMPIIKLPEFKLHPATFTSSPFTSPHKTLMHATMLAERMLHAPYSYVAAPGGRGTSRSDAHVSSNRIENSTASAVRDDELSDSVQNNISKRKIRLAAHFPGIADS